ncbi:YciI family protein [Mangrovimonas xylaniphaga]|uniref:YciI family protein n=1 Tax=Mangrovimonas xylaniphaga TaxID=1645915 RepID=UPI0006B63948|nr:YciI family protein [Mangrovimonas xylaniphaga]
MRKIIVMMFVFGMLFACKDNSKGHEESNIETTVEAVVDSIVVQEETLVEKKISVRALKDSLTSKGFQTFEYVDSKTKDTVLMQQYFIAFLKKGTVRNQNEEEAALLQEEHLKHLGKMYELGYADISGPFGDDGDIRGITIYNVPTLGIADSLAKSDPMVKAGRLEVEVHPWWAAKGFQLR